MIKIVEIYDGETKYSEWRYDPLNREQEKVVKPIIDKYLEDGFVIKTRIQE